MTNTTTKGETMTNTTEVIKVSATEFGVSKTKAEQIESVFVPMVARLKEFDEQYDKIQVAASEDITKDVCASAKRLRLDIKKVRVDAEKARKAEKEEYLRAGKAIDGVANILKFAVTEKENALGDIENHFENLEKERIEKLNAKRIDEVSQYDVEAEHIKLGEMDDDVYANYLAGVKASYEQKIAAEKKAEADRIAKEKADAEERERQRIENEKLKAERDAMLKKQEAERKERERVEAERLAKEQAEQKKRDEELRKEREAQAKKQAEIEAKLEAERKERERIEAERVAKEEAERKEQELLAKADDDKKLGVFIDKLRALYREIPKIKDKKRAKKIQDKIAELAELCEGG